MTATGRAAASALLWLCAALGIAGAAIWLAAFTGLARPLVVVSDSMRPAFAAGDLLLALRAPTAEVRAGDVVAVEAGDRLVAHRVVRVVPAGAERERHGERAEAEGSAASGWRLTLRGDANPVGDPRPYPVGDAVLRIAWVWPQAGRAVEALASPAIAVPLAVGLVALLGLVMLRARLSPRGARRARRPRAAHTARP